ncbi:zinc finger protein 98-like isoform X2 [Bacillus rossius redtenbacheri]
MALLGLPRPQLYGTSIRPKPVPLTNTSSANKACETNSGKPSRAEDLKPILFVSVKEEAQEHEDCNTTAGWEDEEADSFSDTIYPALLCSPDLESPSSPDLNSGDNEQIWSCTEEVGPGSFETEEDVEKYQLKFADRSSSQFVHCRSQKTGGSVNLCRAYKIKGAKHGFNCGSESCDCSGVLLAHSVQHKLSTTKQFTCTKCGKSYKQQKNLKKHCERFCRKKFHSRVGKRKRFNLLRCDVCDRKFTTNQHLKNHVLTHGGKRPYTCDICECSFIYKSHVTRHRLTHTNERHYVCDYCSYSFIQKSNFHLHMRTLACLPTPTAKRVCDFCYQAFSKKMYLDSHLKKHASIFISTE